MQLPDYTVYRLEARRRQRKRMLVLFTLLALGVVCVFAACSAPTAPSSSATPTDSTQRCPKGRTDCSPYLVPRDTIRHL